MSTGKSHESLIKTETEIEKMRKGGEILARIVDELGKFGEEANNTLEIEELSEQLIRKYGVISAFKTVYDYKYNTCLSVDDAIIHGIPSNFPLKIGGVLKVDMGIVYEGMYLDHALTVIVGEHSENFDTTKFSSSLKIRNFAKSILKSIEENKSIKAGCLVTDISKIIHTLSMQNGFYPCEDYVGHGVGKSLHEQPDIFCFYDENLPRFVLKENMTVAIEPMISEKRGLTYIDKGDNFTVRILGGGLSAFFEDTVLIKNDGIEVLTRF